MICVWIKELEYNGRKNTSQDFLMIVVVVVVAEERMYRSRLVKVHVFIEQRSNGFIFNYYLHLIVAYTSYIDRQIDKSG